jgi:hypothetical protein
VMCPNSQGCTQGASHFRKCNAPGALELNVR